MEGECKLCKRRRRLTSCPILDEKEKEGEECN